MKLTVTFAGVLLFLTGILFPLHLEGKERGNIAEWRIYKEKNNNLTLSLHVAEGGYIYLSSLQIEILSGKNEKLSPVPQFKGKTLPDPISGENTLLLEGTAPFSWQIPMEKKSYPLSGKITFQGCWKAVGGKEGICLFPEEFSFTIPDDSFSFLVLFPDLNKEKKNYSPSSPSGVAPFLPSFTILRSFAGNTTKETFLSFLQGKKEEKNLFKKGVFEGKSIFLVLFLTLLGGLALNLTPCVLPMIPLNLAIIGASSRNESRRNKIIRGFLYGSGIAIAYGVLGAVCVLTGSSMGALDSTWYFNAASGAVMIFLGLSLFDFYSIDLTRLGNSFGRVDSAKLAGVFLLGVMTSLLAGACVAPMVAAVLIHSASLYSEGDFSALFLPFVLGVGMALPWPVAAGGLSILPKPGKWMVKVKYLFGIFIIGLGLYYAYQSYRIVDHLYIRKESTPRKNVKGLVSAMEEAKREKKLLFVSFGAIWCKNCTVMKKGVLQDKTVKSALKEFVTYEFDASDVTDKTIDGILKAMKVNGLPYYVILSIP